MDAWGGSLSLVQANRPLYRVMAVQIGTLVLWRCVWLLYMYMYIIEAVSVP